MENCIVINGWEKHAILWRESKQETRERGSTTDLLLLYMLEDCKWLIGWELNMYCKHTHEHLRTLSRRHTFNNLRVVVSTYLKNGGRMLMWLASISSEGKERTIITHTKTHPHTVHTHKHRLRRHAMILLCPFCSWTFCSVLRHNQILIRGLGTDWLQEWLITALLVRWMLHTKQTIQKIF